MFFSKRKVNTYQIVFSTIALIFATALTHAKNPDAAGSASLTTLKEVFDAAWLRQPEARAINLRRDAAQAQAKVASQLSPEPAALEIIQRGDQMTGNYGSSETYVGLAIPIWLPGQRDATGQLAQAEISFVESKQLSAQLRVAFAVRDAWWNWQRTRIDNELARVQLVNASRLAVDVNRRVQAGELARADQHQAEGAVQAAKANLAQSQASFALALAQVQMLIGGATPSESNRTSVSEPEPPKGHDSPHPLLKELQDRIIVAERTVSLVSSQNRSNPQLTIGAKRDRSTYGENYGQSILVGVRFPFGDGPRYDARVANAQAEAIEVHAQLQLEKARLIADQQAARSRVESVRVQLQAAQRRAQLARESRGFFDKSFRLGESDLPTRLRIETEAIEAERQEARTRIELGAAISALRQTTGLLPE